MADVTRLGRASLVLAVRRAGSVVVDVAPSRSWGDRVDAGRRGRTEVGDRQACVSPRVIAPRRGLARQSRPRRDLRSSVRPRPSIRRPRRGREHSGPSSCGRGSRGSCGRARRARASPPLDSLLPPLAGGPNRTVDDLHCGSGFDSGGRALYDHALVFAVARLRGPALLSDRKTPKHQRQGRACSDTRSG